LKLQGTNEKKGRFSDYSLTRSGKKKMGKKYEGEARGGVISGAGDKPLPGSRRDQKGGKKRNFLGRKNLRVPEIDDDLKKRKRERSSGTRDDEKKGLEKVEDFLPGGGSPKKYANKHKTTEEKKIEEWGDKPFEAYCETMTHRFPGQPFHGMKGIRSVQNWSSKKLNERKRIGDSRGSRWEETSACERQKGYTGIRSPREKAFARKGPEKRSENQEKNSGGGVSAPFGKSTRDRKSPNQRSGGKRKKGSTPKDI